MKTPLIFKIENCLGPLEKEIMDIVWDEEEVTVRQVLEKVNSQKRLAYTTVMTIMDNLYKKGFLKRTRNNKTFVYEKTQNQKVLVKNSISTSLNELNKNYGTLKIIFAMASLGIYAIPLVYSLNKFRRSMDITAGWYSLSLTIVISLLIFSVFDLIQNLKFFGTIDYFKLFLSEPKEIMSNLDLFFSAISESFPVMNFSTTMISLALVIVLAKRLSNLFESSKFNLEINR